MANEKVEDYRKAGNNVYDKLRLLTFPVAIKFIKEYSEIPKKAQQPSKLNQKLSLCQSFTMARRWGTHVAMTFEDNACITSSLVHQWKKVSREDIIESQVISEYHKDKKAEIRIQSQLKDLATEESYNKIKDHKGFVVSPLHKTYDNPDIVLIYGDPAQITHIIHSLTYEGKHLVESPFIGYGESCIKGVLLPYVTGEPQVVLPGTGDRTLSLTKEEEMAIGVPAELIFYINENMFKSGGVFNMRQPTRFFLGNLPKGFGPPAWNFLKKQLRKKEKENETPEER